VTVPTHVVVHRVNSDDDGLADDTDYDKDSSTGMVAGVVVLALSAIFFVIALQTYLDCSSGGECDAGAELVVATVGTFLLIAAIALLSNWVRSRARSSGF
jgi:hypothetical protein